MNEEQRLKEIEERTKAAYPGPWFFNSYSMISSGTCQRTGRHETTPEGFNNCPIAEDHDDECTPTIAWVPAAHGDTAGPQDQDNAQFIADARQDIDWLISEHHRLSDELARAREQFDEFRSLAASLAGERFGELHVELEVTKTRLDAALRVVEAARNVLSRFDKDCAVKLGTAPGEADNAETLLMRSALSEFDRASAEEPPKQSQDDLSIWSNSPSLSSSRSNDRLINGA